MKLSYEELKKVLSNKGIEKLFEGGHPCPEVNYKIERFNIRWSAEDGCFYVDWIYRKLKTKKDKNKILKEYLHCPKNGKNKYKRSVLDSGSFLSIPEMKKAIQEKRINIISD